MTHQASAELLTSNWKAENDRQVLLDTDTGIEWLKISQTAGKSNEEIVTGMASGGIYEGWRAATLEEVYTLTQAFIPSTISGSRAFYSYSSVGYAGGMDWLSKMGMTDYITERFSTYTAYHTESIGRVLDLNNTSDEYYHKHSGTTQRRTNTNPNGSLYFGSNSNYNFSAGNKKSGVFLVSDGGLTLSSVEDPAINANNPNAPSDVIAPAMLGFASLILGLVVTRRKRVGG